MSVCPNSVCAAWAPRKPFYRIVVADQLSATGASSSFVGTYDPRADPAAINVDAERVAHWISNGAQPSDSVAQLFRRVGLLDENGKLVAQEQPVAEAS